MFASIKRFFGIVETDLSKIMHVFHTAKADLEAHILLHREAAAAAERKATEATVAAEALHVAADDAEAVLDKIKSFVG